MKKSQLLCFFFISMLVTACVLSNPPSPTRAEIQYAESVPIDDARVSERNPDNNYGSEDYMSVGKLQPYQLEMWIRFNLTDMASTYDDLSLKSAVLKLEPRGTYGTPANVQVQVWATQTGWSESSITWNNKPSLLTNYTDCAFTGEMFSETTWRRVPLNKSDVEKWMSSGDKLYSICLTAKGQTDPGAYSQVFSKESPAVPSLQLYFAPEGADPNSQVAVLVDTTVQDLNPGYFELFARGVEKWLEWWKMDYEEIDLRTTTITQSLLSRYNLILIAQFNLTLSGNLDSSELQAINRSVYEDGVGLVQVDSYLTGYNDIWSGYDKLFDVTVQGWVSSTKKMNLTVVDNTHFITEIYRNGTEMNALFQEESDLTFEDVVVGDSAKTLVVMPQNGANSPALVAKSHGNGRTVLSTFSTGRVDLGYDSVDGFGEKPLKTNSGMHGLLWRSMVWTAKKPFAFMGMPPFCMFRIENFGVGASFSHVDKIVEHGFFVHLNVFVSEVNSVGSAFLNRLKSHYWNGNVHVGPSSWTNNWQIYWNLPERKEVDDSTLSQYFNWLDGNQTAWNVTYSAWRKPAFCAIGNNVVSYFEDREWYFIGSKNKIPFDEGNMNKWMWQAGAEGGPERNCLVIMDFADENDTIFNVMLYLPINNASYWTPSALVGAYNPPNVTKATEQMLSQLEHGLTNLFWGDCFTHDNYAAPFGASNWDTALTWVRGNLTSQYPFTITTSREYIAHYVFNRRHLSISDYGISGNTLTLNFSGTTNLPMAFYLFTDQKISSYSGTLDHFRSYGNDGYLVWIPAYSGNHQVSIILGSSETNNPHIHYTMSNVTSTSVSPNAFTIQASAIWRHTDPKYRFEVNCASRGQPSSVEVDGTPVSFNYDRTTRIVSFNVTFPSLQDIVVSWQENAHLVIRDLDNSIRYRLYNSSVGSWENWSVLPTGKTCDSPAAATLNDELHIVIRGFSWTSVPGNRSLWHGSLNLLTGVFSGWTKISGATTSPPTLVASQSLNSLCPVIRGLNDRVYYNTWNGTEWEGWTALPGAYTCDSPAAAILDDKLHIVFRDANSTGVNQNCSLWHGSVNLSTGAFSELTLLQGKTPSPPSLAASQPLNSLCLVVRGMNNSIHHNTWNSTEWEGWSVLPSGTTSDGPAATILGDELHIVFRGFSATNASGNFSLWHGSVNRLTQVFSGWAKLDGLTRSAPSLAASHTLHRTHLVVRGLNNRIYYRLHNSSADYWSSWSVLPRGTTCDSPAAAVLGDELHVVVRGFSVTSVSGNLSLWHGSVNLLTKVFSGWTRVSGATESAPTLTASETLNSLCLVVRGLNNRIYHNMWNGTEWEGWKALPEGYTCDSPAAVMLGDELHIVVRGFSEISVSGNRSLWHGSVNLTTGVFSGWTRVSGATESAPTLTASETLNSLCLVVRGLNNRIYYDMWNGSDWEGWKVLPKGTTSDGPGAAIVGSELHIVVRGISETTLWHYYTNLTKNDNSGWTRVSGATPSAPTVAN